MLIDDIRKDRIVAFKAKENIKKDILGCLIADSCKEVKEPDDTKVLSIVKKFIENAEEVMKQVPESDYSFYKASMEIDILKEYRPKQLTENEILDIMFIVQNGDGSGNAPEITFPQWMKYFKENYLNQYDGAVLSKVVKSTL
jgi:uncharacterized protein YqeY